LSSIILKNIYLALYLLLFYIRVMKKANKKDAMVHCANWNAGKCLGAMMYRRNDKLRMTIDKKKADKDCIVDEGCDYFDNIVIPGMENNGN